ncbi:MAG TPA: hypothetical protein VF498_11140 [Anaerolineales bacterium]
MFDTNHRFLPAALIGFGLVLLLGAFGYIRLNDLTQHPGSEPLPEQLLNLPLNMSSIGQVAVTEFTSLHGEDFPVSSGAVGMYGDDHQATLWVAGTPLKPIADRLLAAMHEKIEQGGSPFIPKGDRKDGSRVIYELDGMGQKHFYFQSGRRIIWLAAGPDFADQALSQVLKFYP